MTEAAHAATAERVCRILRRHRLPLQSEKRFQQAMLAALEDGGVWVDRERWLDGAGRVDFYLAGLAIEAKLRYRRADIRRQLERYAKSDDVDALLLVTLTSLELPEQMNGKPLYTFRLGPSQL